MIRVVTDKEELHGLVQEAFQKADDIWDPLDTEAKKSLIHDNARGAVNEDDQGNVRAFLYVSKGQMIINGQKLGILWALTAFHNQDMAALQELQASAETWGRNKGFSYMAFYTTKNPNLFVPFGFSTFATVQYKAI